MSIFSFGIEHEVAFTSKEEQILDFTTDHYQKVAAIIARLPQYEQDYPQLRVGDKGIRVKRWYIEGFERLTPEGELTTCIPKGIEIRTTIHPDIRGAIDELQNSFQRLIAECAQENLFPILTSFNPFETAFEPSPPLNSYEEDLLLISPEDESSFLTMLTYGPDLNFSLSDVDTPGLIEIAKKLTFYSPYIIPFSFSSPFYAGKLWDGLSRRTFQRTGIRPAALVFLEREEDLIHSNPSLTKLAKSKNEIGRIEFKACDCCADFSIYAGLFALLKGLALDTTLPGRALLPDAKRHQWSARHGFANEEIYTMTHSLLEAASSALTSDADAQYLQPLYSLLEARQSPAHQIIQVYQQTGSIITSLRAPYTTSKH